MQMTFYSIQLRIIDFNGKLLSQNFSSQLSWALTLRNKNKNKLRSFKSSEHNNENVDGPYRGFDYKSLFSDPLVLAKWSQREIL